MLMERHVTLRKPLLQGRKLRPPLGQPASLRVQRFGHRAYVGHLLPDHDTVRGHRRQARVDTLGEPG
jgi:hypothetical protein